MSNAAVGVPLADSELNMKPEEWAEAFAEDPSCIQSYLSAAMARGRAERQPEIDALADALDEALDALVMYGPDQRTEKTKANLRAALRSVGRPA